MSLTTREKDVIAIARRLAGLTDIGDIMAYTGETDPDLARSNLLGQAQFTLTVLA